ncbi:MAG TPA: 3-hydroxyacyl-CoA dehydrogenase NAD-binding domain-containing protein [Oscillatoriaceae cyanobacterium]
MPALTLTKRPDGVAVVTFDTPDSPVNVLSRELLGEFTALLDQIEADDEIRAVVAFSGKKDSFIAGANIQEILTVTDPTEASALSHECHVLFNRMAASKKPFVAAIHGPALGGGLEFALACHYRLATDSPKTVLALPEVQLGLLPGGGGTQRLPRVVGLLRALPMMLTGERVRVKKAKRDGLVDAVTSPFGLLETACQAARRLASGELVRKPRKVGNLEKLLSAPPLRQVVFTRALRDVMDKTRGLYPAPLAILECVESGVTQGFAAGEATEERLFGKLVVSPEAKNLIWLFNAMNALKKLPKEPAPKQVHKLGVLGAGLMGEGIASVSLGLNPVVIKDVSDTSLSKAAKNMFTSLSKRVRSGSLTNVEKERQWSRLRFSTDYKDLAGSELVIEAVFEKLSLKRQVLAETEAVLAPDAVFASNTSALPIHEIAAEAKHPERVLGMHYFSPVPKMPLLEIVVADKTADWALATAQAYGVAQGKTVIVVKDGPGFYTTRILAPFMNEAIQLLTAGAEIEQLDNALRDFGFPVGPVTLLDEVGIDVGMHVGRDLGQAFAARGMGASDALERMVEAGYLGRKNGKGFYRYEGKKGKGKQVNPEAYRFFGGPGRQEFDPLEMRDRLVLVMVNEVAHCLGEGIVASPRDADIGAIMGLGFPPFRGGPCHYVDTVGIHAIVERLRELEARHGVRFAPAPLLLEMLEQEKGFYGPQRVPQPV